MKFKKLYILTGIISGLILGLGYTVYAATLLFPHSGGTGTGVVPSYGQVLVGNAGGTYTPTATSSLGISLGGATSTDPLMAAYFVGTSTTATSTFAGGLAVETSGFVYDYSTNKVGIGTASPSRNLVIVGTDNLTARVQSSNTNATGLEIANTSSGGKTFEFFSTGSASGGGVGRFGVYDQTGNQDLLSLSIAKSYIPVGNFGIGTTSPYAKLSVVGEAVASHFTATTTSTSTLPRLTVNSALSLFGTFGTALSDFCVAITGGSGLCDGTDATGSGGAAAVATSTNETAGRLAYWTSTSGTPATLGEVATSTPTVTAPISYSGTLGSFVGGVAGAFDCISASGSVKGCLTSADWTTFNNKQSTISTTFPITLSGATIGFGGLSTSTAAVTGNIPYFSGVNTFANVATTTFALPEFTVTGTLGNFIGGANSSASLTTNGVGLTKIAQIAANTVLGNSTGATGNVTAVATSSLFVWNGTGNVVRTTSPTLVTPALGTPSSGVATNLTGLPLTTGVTGTLPVANGGTGATTVTGLLQGNGTSAITGITGTVGQFPYYNGSNTLLATSTVFLATTGNVGVGTTSPSTLLQLFSTGTTTLSIDSNSTSKGSCIELKDRSGVGYTYLYVEDGAVYSTTVSCK